MRLVLAIPTKGQAFKKLQILLMLQLQLVDFEVLSVKGSSPCLNKERALKRTGSVAKLAILAVGLLPPRLPKD